MKHLFVPYEIAKLLKEKGFNEKCIAMYTNRYTGGLESPVSISQHEGSSVKGDKNTEFKSTEYEYVTAPIYQQIIDWLYDKGISLEIYTCSEDSGKSFNHTIRKVGRKIYEIKALDNKCVPNRYEAMNKGIIEALKLIK